MPQGRGEERACELLRRRDAEARRRPVVEQDVLARLVHDGVRRRHGGGHPAVVVLHAEDGEPAHRVGGVDEAEELLAVLLRADRALGEHTQLARRQLEPRAQRRPVHLRQRVRVVPVGQLCEVAPLARSEADGGVDGSVLPADVPASVGTRLAASAAMDATVRAAAAEDGLVLPAAPCGGGVQRQDDGDGQPVLEAERRLDVDHLRGGAPRVQVDREVERARGGRPVARGRLAADGVRELVPQHADARRDGVACVGLARGRPDGARTRPLVARRVCGDDREAERVPRQLHRHWTPLVRAAAQLERLPRARPVLDGDAQAQGDCGRVRDDEGGAERDVPDPAHKGRVDRAPQPLAVPEVQRRGTRPDQRDGHAPGAPLAPAARHERTRHLRRGRLQVHGRVPVHPDGVLAAHVPAVLDAVVPEDAPQRDAAGVVHDQRRRATGPARARVHGTAVGTLAARTRRGGRRQVPGHTRTCPVLSARRRGGCGNPCGEKPCGEARRLLGGSDDRGGRHVDVEREAEHAALERGRRPRLHEVALEEQPLVVLHDGLPRPRAGVVEGARHVRDRAAQVQRVLARLRVERRERGERRPAGLRRDRGTDVVHGEERQRGRRAALVAVVVADAHRADGRVHEQRREGAAGRGAGGTGCRGGLLAPLPCRAPLLARAARELAELLGVEWGVLAEAAGLLGVGRGRHVLHGRPVEAVREQLGRGRGGGSGGGSSGVLGGGADLLEQPQVLLAHAAAQHDKGRGEVDLEPLRLDRQRDLAAGVQAEELVDVLRPVAGERLLAPPRADVHRCLGDHRLLLAIHGGDAVLPRHGDTCKGGCADRQAELAGEEGGVSAGAPCLGHGHVVPERGERRADRGVCAGVLDHHTDTPQRHGTRPVAGAYTSLRGLMSRGGRLRAAARGGGEHEPRPVVSCPPARLADKCGKPRAVDAAKHRPRGTRGGEPAAHPDGAHGGRSIGDQRAGMPSSERPRVQLDGGVLFAPPAEREERDVLGVPHGCWLGCVLCRCRFSHCAHRGLRGGSVCVSSALGDQHAARRL